jgi:hypothetical protein
MLDLERPELSCRWEIMLYLIPFIVTSGGYILWLIMWEVLKNFFEFSPVRISKELIELEHYKR